MRHDLVWRQIFGYAHVANFKSIIRFLGKLNRWGTYMVFMYLYHQLYKLIIIMVTALVKNSFDITGFGLQQGMAQAITRSPHSELIEFNALTM